jgi:hypothetical protein
MGVSEAVLNWGIPNILSTVNNTLIVTINGTPYTATVPQGFYTVQALLDALVVSLNTAATGVATFSIVTRGAERALSSTVEYNISPTALSYQMNFGSPNFISAVHTIDNPVILNYNYIDFVCNDITYNQALKDSSTNPNVRDVLYRWWFAWDSPPVLDTYGYPILQGYTPFTARRAIAFPKQIRWENKMPVGNLSFAVYGNNPNMPNAYSVPLDARLTSYGNMEWGMNFLVSED